jgi:hypothetical protein
MDGLKRVYGNVSQFEICRHLESAEDSNANQNQLYDTINLKQNNASIIEAHATRREGDAIILFTVVSSITVSRHFFLASMEFCSSELERPLSFFSSIFRMNVVEIAQGSKATLARAMSFIGEIIKFCTQILSCLTSPVPLPILVTSIALLFAF